jgi:hypothetical protein
MQQIVRDSLLTLEAYAKARPALRKQVIEHKKRRTVHLGEHLTLLFEDLVTIRYQIQEMLRIEKIFEEDGIQHEIDTYSPMLPDGTDFKATMLIEYEDEDERRQALRQLKGVERKVWIQVTGSDRVFAIADEDLERENDEKTSAVHFLRFELAKPMISALKSGTDLSIGVDHPNYCATVAPVGPAIRDALVNDLA